MIQSYYGAMFSMQTKPEHRRKGWEHYKASWKMNENWNCSLLVMEFTWHKILLAWSLNEATSLSLLSDTRMKHLKACIESWALRNNSIQPGSSSHLTTTLIKLKNLMKLKLKKAWKQTAKKTEITWMANQATMELTNTKYESTFD